MINAPISTEASARAVNLNLIPNCIDCCRSEGLVCINHAHGSSTVICNYPVNSVPNRGMQFLQKAKTLGSGGKLLSTKCGEHLDKRCGVHK